MDRPCQHHHFPCDHRCSTRRTISGQTVVVLLGTETHGGCERYDNDRSCGHDHGRMIAPRHIVVVVVPDHCCVVASNVAFERSTSLPVSCVSNVTTIPVVLSPWRSVVVDTTKWGDSIPTVTNPDIAGHAKISP